MSAIDLFSWAILIVLVIGIAAFFVFMAILPGRIARARNHPWAEAVNVAGWVTLICCFVLWPVALIWAYVDAPARSSRESAP